MLRSRPPEPPADAGGLPAAGRSELVVARALAATASCWFLLVAGWELFGPLLAGHFATNAAIAIAAENMLRWHIAGPVTTYTSTHPGFDLWYSHHPWGIFWTNVPFVALFGHHDFVSRLPPVLLSAVTPPLFYLTGRAIWRPAAGAAAAVAFVVLPITLSFAQFNALEVPVIAWGMLATWSLVRYTQTSARSYLFLSTFGAFAAMNADWPAFLLVGGIAAFSLLAAPLRGPRGFDETEARRIWRLCAFWCATALFTGVFYLVLFRSIGTLPKLEASYDLRSRGHDKSLSSVLEHRRYWLQLCFTPIAIFLGKVGLPVVLARLVVLRRQLELLPLAWLVLAAVQYIVFWQGAEIHIFWSHYFAAYFALAIGAITASLISAGERIAAPKHAGRASLVWAVTLALVLLPLAAILRDGVPALVYARGTGGRFNEKGLVIDSDGSKTAFLRFIEPRLPPGSVIDEHEGMKRTWSQEWALKGREVREKQPVPDGPSADGHDIYLLDTRLVPDEKQAALAQRFHVLAVGPFWMIRRNEPASPIEAFSIQETEPSPFEWYFISGTEPHREVVPDPFLTWELRRHFGQQAKPPTDSPHTFEQRRIAHNIAVDAGDQEGAARIERELLSELTPTPARLSAGVELLGAHYRDGAGPLLTLLFKSEGPVVGDEALRVRSNVLAPARFSSTMADPVEREVALPLSLQPQRFRAGFLYQDDVPIRKRPGTESFRVSFQPKPPEWDSSFEVLRLQ